MVTLEHESLHRIFREDPELFARTIQRVFDVDMPVPEKVTMLNCDLTEMRPVERRVDSVMLAEFLVESRQHKYILVIESQTEPEETRRTRWPYAIAYLHDRFGCDVVLLVVTSKAATQAWAQTPITIGLRELTCMVVQPVVLGPANVPVVSELTEAKRDVCFTVFSALTYSRSKQVGGILEVLAEALGTVDADTGSLLAEFTEAGLGRGAGREIWRKLVATKSYPFVSQLRAQGRIEGRIEDILRILDRRGIAIPEEIRERIESCADAESLDRLLDRALTVTDAADLF